MPDVLITGVGVVSPIGIGVDAVGASLQAKRSGIRTIDELAMAEWIAPFGGAVTDFDGKKYVQPRKSLKVMAREIQLAFAAGEMAWTNAGLDAAEVDPERVGVVGAAGLLYCGLDELVSPMAESLNERGEVDLKEWGNRGMRQLFPLWMLKYLPNMAACHVGIRRQAFGPTNTISLGDVSSLLAIGEAAAVIQRGAADVMLAGGTSTKLDLTDLVFHGGLGLSRRAGDPAGACRPFDRDRDGFVLAEGAAYFVLESREHAERRAFAQRGGQAWGAVEGVCNRCEPSIETRQPTGKAIAAAVNGVLETTGVAPSDLAMVKAHGSSRPETDAMEAATLAEIVGDAPVTAPTSYVGCSGAASGAVELALALVGWRQGVVPATLNYQTPDPACPVNVAGEHRPATGDALLALNYALTGQAVAALIRRA
ncbi:3-oxoacyl-[acyl-carrier-protein] synthase 2 [Botrimarina colliarenosi]|uniref:3-oxoacyl-[acyl-carrier-protein] synthase 2 n=1 Tax=Botrimarina colliarenosi TaxID=2528001 RepID=A0A5C6A5Z3_9BACT|nr:beta-ketoacyl synthase N-terminal-like domain-containing protein [Botrimarina colliarenosi]TWT94856.1 3-oxoacyl-[acyl-carrier-protein] synthase 2 [Botrimarina colliarenosi]